MPKNKGKGGKNRRRGKNDNENDKRELIFKEEGQEYAQVSRMLGNGRLEASCFDGNKRLGHIRGKMRKKVWIGNGDIVLLSLREFEDEKADIIHKYSPDEARALKQYGELPNEARINENEAFGDDDLEGEIEFGEQQDEQGDEDSEESEVDINDL
ncbi:Eukaryotic translation initiation factor 1A [Wallemia ichthyophaga EXF-994]|nr:Eukaryotic translation initiation factor 1A [Wallemia ichthyophaga EXF-994]EOR00256.1 Eukaryotic translation initiation factor 1A [Wallemia ichthyophaga EXF-994]